MSETSSTGTHCQISRSILTLANTYYGYIFVGEFPNSRLAPVLSSRKRKQNDEAVTPLFA
ncbi:protein of unknown function [Burkholderia multivorans]